LDETGFKLCAEPPPEGGQGVVVRMSVAGQITEGGRVVGGSLVDRSILRLEKTPVA
jgi:hypothetical protein